MITVGQVPEGESLTKVTVVVEQLSVAVTDAAFGAGTSAAHCTTSAPGHVIWGGVVSFTVMVWVHVAVFPQASVAW